MKRKFIITLIFMSFLIICRGQKTRGILFNVSDLNGIWSNVIDDSSYTIFKNGKSILFTFNSRNNFYHEKDFNPFSFYGVEKYGFVSNKDSLLRVSPFCYSDKDLFSWGGAVIEFEFDNIHQIGGVIELIGGKVNIYRREKNLPSFFFKYLYYQGKKDKQNYLKEFLNMIMGEIIVSKSIVYYVPNYPSKQYLIKNDEVEILEEKLVKGTSWLKIRYYGSKTIEGWIKKTDVE